VYTPQQAPPTHPHEKAHAHPATVHFEQKHQHAQPPNAQQQMTAQSQQQLQQQQPSLSDLSQRRLDLLEKLMELQAPTWHSPFAPFVHSPVASSGLAPFHNPWQHPLLSNSLSPFNNFGMGLSPFTPSWTDPFSSLYNTQSALQRSMQELNQQLSKVEEQSITSSWHETDKAFVLDVKLPKGIKKDDLKVNVRKNVLTVSGSVNLQDDATGSVSSSSFTRMLTVPDEVDQQAISANLDGAVLKIMLQKTAKAIEEEKKGEIKIQHAQQQPVGA